MPALIGAIGTVVNMNQAVYGNAMGNPAYQSQLAVATATGGQAALIAGYNASLASQANATLATTVLNNMFVTTAAGVSAANVTALTTALTQAFAAYPSAKGQVISNLANLLGGLEGEASWGPAATAFNNQAAADFVYSNNTANTNAGVPSSTTTTSYTLTTNADGPGAIAPAANTTGTSGADTYNGTIAAAAANGDNGTLNSFDNLAGGTGVDVLVARITALAGATTIAPQMSSVDTIQLGNVVAAANTGTLDLVSATGTTTVGFLDTVAVSQSAIINASTTAAIVMNNADGAQNFVNLGLATGRTGTADAFNLTIQNGSAGSAAVPVAGGTNTAAVAAGFGLITAAGAADATFEVANITVGAGATNSVAIAQGGAAITTVNVTGAGTPNAAGAVLGLTEAGNFANVTTINASGLTTGGLNIATTLQQNVTFTGSGFNDRLNVTGGVANLTGADAINFGAGTADVLAFGTTADFRAVTLGTATTALINGIASADVLESTLAGAIQVRGADWTTINTFWFTGATNAAVNTNNVTITGLETADTFRFAADIRTIGAAGAAAGNNGTAGVDNILLGGQSVGQTANLIFAGGVDLSSTGGAGNAGANGNAGGVGGNGGAGASAIDVANGGANISVLNIQSLGTVANALIGGAGGAGAAGGNSAAGNANGGNGGNAGAGGVAIDNGAGLSAVNITGTADITIAGGAGAAGGAGGTLNGTGVNGTAGTTTLQAAGFSAAVNVNASALTGVLTVSGSTAADAMTGGVNNDIITTFGGLDSLTGGAGTDDFRINGTAVTSATAFITISDFSAGDQISILSQVRAAGAAVAGGTALNGVAVFNSTAVNVSTAANFAGALDLASALAGNANTQVTWFNWSDGNTYVVVDNTAGGATYTAATDAIIQLTGVKTLTVGSVDFA